MPPIERISPLPKTNAKRAAIPPSAVPSVAAKPWRFLAQRRALVAAHGMESRSHPV